LHKSAKDNCIPAVFKKDNKTIQSKDVADLFNEYFFNIAHSLQTHPDESDSPFKLLKNAYQPILQSLKVIPVAKGEIISIMCSLK
jgi:hypothetical protein